ncbi:MAG: lysostaphin resistance A-like protein [Flavobacterium sp.]
MYIEKAIKPGNHPLLYLPIPLFFFGIIIVNAFFASDINTEEIIRLSIEKFGRTTFFAIMVGQLAVALFVVLFWVKFVHKQSITDLTTSRNKIDWRRVFFSFSVWGLLTIVITLIAYYLSPSDFVVQFNWEKFLPFAIIALLLIPLQTSFEEYFFRGYLMQGLGWIFKNRWMPLIITSVSFGLMHIANPEVGKIGHVIMVYYIGTGFFLGMITLLDEGLELALGFHAANNLIGALLVTADWTAFQTYSVLKDTSEPNVSWDVLVPVVVIFPLLLIIFGKKYKWTNWVEKLTGKVHVNN